MFFRFFLILTPAALLTLAPLPAAATDFLVDTADDVVALDGLVSLREAVDNANSNLPGSDAPAGTPGEDTIRFAPTLAGATIALTAALVVGEELVVEGLGETGLSLDGQDATQIFIVAGGPLTLRDLALRNGRGVDGGAVRVASGQALALEDVTVADSVATERGGGIFGDDAALEVTRGNVAGNVALGVPLPTKGGGGIFSLGGSLTLTDVAVTGNRADGFESVGGGAIVLGGVLTVTGGSFIGNRSDTAGGGLSADNFTIDGTRFEANDTGRPNRGEGGAASLSNGTIDNSVFVGNTAFWMAGALYLTADVTITDSTFDGNICLEAGAILHSGGNLTVRRSTFTNNDATAVSGGALLIRNTSNALVVNSTVSGNHGLVFGGGIHTSGTLRVVNSTIVGNSSNFGGGISVESRGSLTIGNSIVSGNMAFSNALVNGDDIYSETTAGSEGYNLIGDPVGANLLGGGGTDVIGVSPKLGPLADNGGPTLTHRPLTGSPVLDAASGAIAASAGATTDQRGFARTVDLAGAANAVDGTDVGAVEVVEEELLSIPTLGEAALAALALLLAAAGIHRLRRRRSATAA